MQQLHLEEKDRATVLAHYYRALVTRADIWRSRMDTTSNWAVVSTAGVLSFALSNPEIPHFVVSISAFMSIGFLLLEAHRLRVHHVWQHRVLLLEFGLMRPALNPGCSGNEKWAEELLREMGQTHPVMPWLLAVGRRLRRVYMGLFGVQWFAWLVKLSQHPTQASSLQEAFDRASVWQIPGMPVMALSLVFMLTVTGLALFEGGRDFKDLTGIA